MGCCSSKPRKKISYSQKNKRKGSLDSIEKYPKNPFRNPSTKTNLQLNLDHFPQLSSSRRPSHEERCSAHYQVQVHNTQKKSYKFNKQDVMELYGTLKSRQQQKIQQIQSQNNIIIPSQEEIMNIDFKEKKQTIQEFFEKNRPIQNNKFCNGCQGEYLSRYSFYSQQMNLGNHYCNKTEHQFTSITSLNSDDDNNFNNNNRDNRSNSQQQNNKAHISPVKIKVRNRTNSLPYNSPTKICKDCNSPKKKFYLRKPDFTLDLNNILNKNDKKQEGNSIDLQNSNSLSEINLENKNQQNDNQEQEFSFTVANEVDDMEQVKKATVSESTQNTAQYYFKDIKQQELQ